MQLNNSAAGVKRVETARLGAFNETMISELEATDAHEGFTAVPDDRPTGWLGPW